MWLKKLLDKTQKPYYNSRYNLGEKMASKNYTDEMVSQMVESYQEQPNLETVASLAQEFGKQLEASLLSCQERVSTKHNLEQLKLVSQL